VVVDLPTTYRTNLELPTPEWAVPLLQPSDLKGAKGGRAGGKSHFYAERLVEYHVCEPYLSSVCIRETLKSLKYSAKRLVEKKIRAMGVSRLFDIRDTEIRRKRHDGGSEVILFQGMQDHTADSIKSLEDFGIAWVDEAQRLSNRSIDLLVPTIRGEGSEIWFSWNPDQETDPVDVLFRSMEGDPDAICVSTNFTDNPFCTNKSKKEAARRLLRDPDGYAHIWLGEYNTKSDDQVLAGRWRIDELEVDAFWDGPYYGADWGFSVDPNTLIECWVKGDTLYIRREVYGHGIEINDTPEFFNHIPDARKHTVRADNARPELISYMNHHKWPRVVAADKWPGSVEDGVSKLRSYNIVIDPSCVHTIEEARLWRYKRDRLTGDILPTLLKGNDHCWDAVRYSLAPLIKQRSSVGVLQW